MKIKELTKEQIEKAKACKTREERLAFLKKYNIEIPEDLLNEVAGGSDATHVEKEDVNDCPNSPSAFNTHEWKWTGRTRPGKIWGDVWPDYEERCVNCGRVHWELYFPNK
ncbi:MAG: hypothetical protein IKD68_12160 [Solobacterium sp.]|nr:hypothetical protein [Solobacterium sp.]